MQRHVRHRPRPHGTQDFLPATCRSTGPCTVNHDRTLISHPARGRIWTDQTGGGRTTREPVGSRAGPRCQAARPCAPHLGKGKGSTSLAAIRGDWPSASPDLQDRPPKPYWDDMAHGGRASESQGRAVLPHMGDLAASADIGAGGRGVINGRTRGRHGAWSCRSIVISFFLRGLFAFLSRAGCRIFGRG